MNKQMSLQIFELGLVGIGNMSIGWLGNTDFRKFIRVDGLERGKGTIKHYLIVIVSPSVASLAPPWGQTVRSQTSPGDSNRSAYLYCKGHALILFFSRIATLAEWVQCHHCGTRTYRLRHCHHRKRLLEQCRLCRPIPHMSPEVRSFQNYERWTTVQKKASSGFTIIGILQPWKGK